MNRELWQDGQQLSQCWPLYRGYSYGDGVFRTCIKYDSELIDIEGQLDHFREDGSALGLRLPPATELLRQLQLASAGHAHACLKLLAIRADQGRGYRWSTADAQILIELGPLPAYPSQRWSDGVRMDTASVRLAQRSSAGGVKHLNRLEQVLASADWPPAVDERLMLDQQDRPVCGTRSNLFWVSSGHVYTPDIAESGIRGRTRARLLDCCRRLGLPAEVCKANRQDLDQADEVFVSNSVIGVWPVAALDERRYQSPGKLTRALMSELAHPRWC